MTRASHTPGPWHVSKSGNYVRHTQSDFTAPNICSLIGIEEERAANARLIAAAPEMRKMLDETIEGLTEILQHYEAVSLSDSARTNVALVRDNCRALLARIDGKEASAPC